MSSNSLQVQADQSASDLLESGVSSTPQIMKRSDGAIQRTLNSSNVASSTPPSEIAKESSGYDLSHVPAISNSEGMHELEANRIGLHVSRQTASVNPTNERNGD